MTSILKPEKAFLIQVVEQSNLRFKYYTLPGKAPRGIEYFFSRGISIWRVMEPKLYCIGEPYRLAIRRTDTDPV